MNESLKSLLEKTQPLIFYLIIFFLPTQLGRHFWPEFSYVSGVRVDYLSPTLFVTDLLILSLFLHCLLSFVLRVRKKRSLNSTLGLFWKKSGLSTKWIFLAWIFILLVGIQLSKSPMAGWYGLLRITEFFFLGLFIAFKAKIYSSRVLVFLFSIGIVGESLLGLLQFFHQSSLGGVFYWLGERSFSSGTPGIANASLWGELWLRPYGTFPHPNVFGGYAMIGTLYVFGQLTRRRVEFSFGSRVFSLLVLLIGALVTLISMSRIAILLFVVVFLGYSFYWKKQVADLMGVSRSLPLLTIGIVLLVFLFILFSPLSSRFAGLLNQDEAVLERLSLTKSALSMAVNNFLFGVGVNNFLVILPHYYTSSSVFVLQPVHNIFLLVFAETGVFGISFFLFFLLKTASGLRWVSRDNFFSLAMFFVLIFLGFFDHYLLTTQQGRLMFVFVLGILWSQIIDSMQSRTKVK